MLLPIQCRIDHVAANEAFLLLLLLLNQGTSRIELIKMHRFFLLIIACLAIAGAVSDSERVEVKSGKSVTLRVETPGNVRRVTLTLRKNCEDRTGDPIIRYCSPGEEKNGCPAKKSDRFSVRFDTESLSIIFVDARVSDEGCYVVSYFDVANILKERFFDVTVHGSLETPEDFPNKAKETHWTISPEYLYIIAVGIALLTAFVILVIICVINCIINCQKKKQNSTGDPEEMISLSSTSSGDESLEMVDVTKCSVDNNNQRSKKDLNHGA
ncbi:uncharacterized protein LOC107694418 isoform X2 [Sinocyclocheilus anshuiensis]|uniref:uncharacterized protein LOC107694418 isoform X2 n=1 Tax=Sinocyclocheilus anshuiensis TaxID=1608454 RepID=UPI0007B9761E|nr:PREDICTED: uncharacterized protein LOC107694418 isoform X2 [Sinocyclocheilus anshuiensis]